MKYNVTDYKRAKNLLETLEKDILEYKRNYVFILTTRKDITSNVITKKSIRFFSSAAFKISTGMIRPIKEVGDIDVYDTFNSINSLDFVSLRAFDFESYQDLIEGHLDPVIDSKGAAEFFKNYEKQLKDVIEQ